MSIRDVISLLKLWLVDHCLELVGLYLVIGTYCSSLQQTFPSHVQNDLCSPGPALAASWGGSWGATLVSLTHMITWGFCNGVLTSPWKGANIRAKVLFVGFIGLYLLLWFLGDITVDYSRLTTMTLSFADVELQRVALGATMMGVACTIS
jgi:hypothetical protein